MNAYSYICTRIGRNAGGGLLRGVAPVSHVLSAFLTKLSTRSSECWCNTILFCQVMFYRYLVCCTKREVVEGEHQTAVMCRHWQTYVVCMFRAFGALLYYHWPKYLLYSTHAFLAPLKMLGYYVCFMTHIAGRFVLPGMTHTRRRGLCVHHLLKKCCLLIPVTVIDSGNSADTLLKKMAAKRAACRCPQSGRKEANPISISISTFRLNPVKPLLMFLLVAPIFFL